jgi:hypothetical protein
MAMLSINLFCQNEKLNLGSEDKINHFSCGYIIGLSGNCIGYEISKNKTIGLLSGIILSSTAGILKENYDRNNGGKFNNQDLKSTVIGGLSGSLTIRIILWNSIHRKKATMGQYFEANE